MPLGGLGGALGCSVGLPVSSVVAGLAIPAIQAAATLTLLNFQNNIAEDRIDESQRIITQAQANYCACLQELLPLLEQATDDVPKASHYNNVSIGGSFFESLKQTVQLAEHAREYSTLYGEIGRDVDLARIKANNPLYDETQEKIWTQLNGYVCGETPVDVAIEITGDAAQTNIINGRIGTCQLTARKLGANSLSMQQLGRTEKRAEEEHYNRNISPLERNPDLQKFVVDPQNRVQWDLEQAQLTQQSIQNAFNLCAKKDPYLLQEWQVRMQCCTSELQTALSNASSVLGFVPNYLGTFGPQINSFFDGIQEGESPLSGLFGFSSNPTSPGAAATAP